MQSALTTDYDLCPELSIQLLLPEFEFANGIRGRIHQHFGMWFVTIRGDVILTRFKFVREGKVEKQQLVDHFVILHDQLISKNWAVHVRRHLRGINMNEFHDAYDLGLELIGYEMGEGAQFCEL